MGGFWPDLLSKVNVKFNLMAIFVFRTQKLVGYSGWMGVIEYFISSAVLPILNWMHLNVDRIWWTLDIGYGYVFTVCMGSNCSGFDIVCLSPYCAP